MSVRVETMKELLYHRHQGLVILYTTEPLTKSVVVNRAYMERHRRKQVVLQPEGHGRHSGRSSYGYLGPVTTPAVTDSMENHSAIRVPRSRGARLQEFEDDSLEHRYFPSDSSPKTVHSARKEHNNNDRKISNGKSSLTARTLSEDPAEMP